MSFKNKNTPDPNPHTPPTGVWALANSLKDALRQGQDINTLISDENSKLSAATLAETLWDQFAELISQAQQAETEFLNDRQYPERKEILANYARIVQETVESATQRHELCQSWFLSTEEKQLLATTEGQITKRTAENNPAFASLEENNKHTILNLQQKRLGEYIEDISTSLQQLAQQDPNKAGIITQREQLIKEWSNYVMNKLLWWTTWVQLKSLIMNEKELKTIEDILHPGGSIANHAQHVGWLWVWWLARLWTANHAARGLANIFPEFAGDRFRNQSWTMDINNVVNRSVWLWIGGTALAEIYLHSVHDQIKHHRHNVVAKTPHKLKTMLHHGWKIVGGVALLLMTVFSDVSGNISFNIQAKRQKEVAETIKKKNADFGRRLDQTERTITTQVTWVKDLFQTWVTEETNRGWEGKLARAMRVVWWYTTTPWTLPSGATESKVQQESQELMKQYGATPWMLKTAMDGVHAKLKTLIKWKEFTNITTQEMEDFDRLPDIIASFRSEGVFFDMETFFAPTKIKEQLDAYDTSITQYVWWLEKLVTDFNTSMKSIQSIIKKLQEVYPLEKLPEVTLLDEEKIKQEISSIKKARTEYKKILKSADAWVSLSDLQWLATFLKEKFSNLELLFLGLEILLLSFSLSILSIISINIHASQEGKGKLLWSKKLGTLFGITSKQDEWLKYSEHINSTDYMKAEKKHFEPIMPLLFTNYQDYMSKLLHDYAIPTKDHNVVSALQEDTETVSDIVFEDMMRFAASPEWYAFIKTQQDHLKKNATPKHEARKDYSTNWYLKRLWLKKKDPKQVTTVEAFLQLQWHTADSVKPYMREFMDDQEFRKNFMIAYQAYIEKQSSDTTVKKQWMWSKRWNADKVKDGEFREQLKIKQAEMRIQRQATEHTKMISSRTTNTSDDEKTKLLAQQGIWSQESDHQSAKDRHATLRHRSWSRWITAKPLINASYYLSDEIVSYIQQNGLKNNNNQDATADQKNMMKGLYTTLLSSMYQIQDFSSSHPNVSVTTIQDQVSTILNTIVMPVLKQDKKLSQTTLRVICMTAAEMIAQQILKKYQCELYKDQQDILLQHHMNAPRCIPLSSTVQVDVVHWLYICQTQDNKDYESLCRINKSTDIVICKPGISDQDKQSLIASASANHRASLADPS